MASERERFEAWAKMVCLPPAGSPESQAAWSAWKARAATPATPSEGPLTVTVPVYPPAELLMSMALRLDHALGCPGYYDEGLAKRDGITHARMLEVALQQMSQVYEEVSGRGFYNEKRKDYYASLLPPAPVQAAPQEQEKP